MLLVESPYKHLSCDCHTQMKRNTAVKLGPVWYVVHFLYSFMLLVRAVAFKIRVILLDLVIWVFFGIFLGCCSFGLSVP